MAYTKQTWEDGTTPLDATHMNHIEDGILMVDSKTVEIDVTSDDIGDATSVGKAVITATDAAAVRTVIGAGTSSLELGTTATTALKGNTSIPSGASLLVGSKSAAITEVAIDGTLDDVIGAVNQIVAALKVRGVTS